MDKRQEFAQAQNEYKEIMAKITKLKADYETSQKKILAEIHNQSIRPLEALRPLRQPKEEIDKAEQERRQATHKLWNLLQSDFSDTAEELSSRNLSKDQLYEEIVNLPAKDLKHLDKVEDK
jgi:hypothetical protein